MDTNSKIYEQIEYQIGQWFELQSKLDWDPKISPKAVETIAQMVINIKEDPSDRWMEYDPNEMQIYAISLIPNILNEMLFKGRPRRSMHRKIQKISSWEILHGISKALDSWCPIPKKF